MPEDDVDMQDVAYDPDQDPEATRDIRRKYRRAVQQLTGMSLHIVLYEHR